MFFRKKIKRKVVYRERKKLVTRGRQAFFQGNPGRSTISLVFYWLSLLVFLGGVVYVFFFSSLVSITQIKVAGTDNLDADAVRQLINRQLTGQYMNFLPKNNILLVNSKAVRQAVSQRYKLIENVSIEKKFPDQLHVQIQERRLGMILCSSVGCLVLDSSGRAFAEPDYAAQELKENELLEIFVGGGREFKIGDRLLDPEYMSYLTVLRDKIKEDTGLEFERKMETPQLASGDIRLKNSTGWMLYLNNEIPPEKEAEMLKIVINEKIDKNRVSDLEYIDLRTDNKVYYKFK